MSQAAKSPTSLRTLCSRNGAGSTGNLLRAIIIVLCGVNTFQCPATARVLAVGPNGAYLQPSAAAAVARDGDTVTIAPGEYFDCAIWQANSLTITGTGTDVVITDQACEGKASFVIRGDGVTVSHIGFARIRVPDANGAGIRAEGRDLTVLDSRFTNNQFGILVSASGGFLRVAGSNFTANGSSPDGQPTYAIAAGALDLLRVESSSFQAARGGAHIISSAQHTELVNNDFADEGGHMSGPMVQVNDGSLLLQGNRFVVDFNAADRPGMVLATGDASSLTVVKNSLIEPNGNVALLRNWTGVTPTQEGNTVPPGILAVSDEGSTYRRLRSRLGTVRQEAIVALRLIRHQAAILARDLHLY